MLDKPSEAAKAYLDEAQPGPEPWRYEEARRWLEESPTREAKGLRAALKAIGEL